MASAEGRFEQALAGWDSGPYMAFLRPVTEALIRAAEIRPGQRVLDVGTGYGDPALDVVAVVGPWGSVVGVDASVTSLVFARRRATDRGLGNVTYQEMDARALQFPEGSFDAVVSRLVIVYFADPVPILREMLRALAPGGRAAVATWAAAEHNPLMERPFEVLRRHLPPTEPSPPSPDRLNTRDPRVLHEAMERAGFAEVATGLVPLSADLGPDDAARYWEERRAGSPASLQALGRLSEAQQAAAEAEVVETIRQLIIQGKATGEVVWAAGRKPFGSL